MVGFRRGEVLWRGMVLLCIISSLFCDVSGRSVLTRYFQQLILDRNTNNQQCPPYYDLGIQKAWALNFTGVGITVAVVDTGIDVTHRDIRQNINTELSYNFVDNNKDVKPQLSHSYPFWEKVTNHGNEMAGLIGAVKGNDLCSAGVAFNSSIVGLRVFSVSHPKKSKSRSVDGLNRVAPALRHQRDHIDIYSCSFSSGIFLTLDHAIADALEDGARMGRHGKGNVFVFPSGDDKQGQQKGFDCNTDPLASSIHTITVAGVDVNGSIPQRAIPCSCILVSAFSKGNLFTAEELSSLLHRDRCTTTKGTSAATALVAGVLALVLHANPSLTPRDLHYLLIGTSSLDQLQDKGLTVANGVGFQYHPFFGFGLVNATALVLKARDWKPVPKQLSFSVNWTNEDSSFYRNRSNHKLVVNVLNVSVQSFRHETSCISHLEHVQADVTVTSDHPSLIQLDLCSPAGTCSRLLHKSKKRDIITKNWTKRWNYTSLQFWGECPEGKWSVMMGQKRKSYQKLAGDVDFAIKAVTITFFGAEYYPIGTPGAGRRETENELLSRDFEELVFQTTTTTSTIPTTIPPAKSSAKSTDGSLILYVIVIIIIVILGAALVIGFACKKSPCERYMPLSQGR